MKLSRSILLDGDPDATVFLSNLERADWFRGGHAQGRSGTNMEAGTVAGTFDFTPDERSVRQRLPVVRADVFDAVQSSPRAEDQNRSVGDHGRETSTFGKFTCRTDLFVTRHGDLHVA
jgi:hypothetical protein